MMNMINIAIVFTLAFSSNQSCTAVGKHMFGPFGECLSVLRVWNLFVQRSEVYIIKP